MIILSLKNLLSPKVNRKKKGNNFLIFRSGGWKKIFPTETASRYKQFFDLDRPLNRLLRDEELKKFKQRNPGININQAIKQFNENPQLDKKK